MSLLRFVDSVCVEVKKTEFQERISVAGPGVDGFFVGGFGSFPFFLLTKAVTKIDEIIRFDRRRSS